MVAVFSHRLYGAITTAHFMAETVPFVKPTTVVSNSGFFGPSMAALPIFGEERPHSDAGRVRTQLRTVRDIGVFGINLIGLSAGAPLDTREFVADVDRLERLSNGDLTRLDDRRLLSLISLARDQVVHGWVLAAGSFLLCAAFNVLLRGLCGRDIAAPGGPEFESGEAFRSRPCSGWSLPRSAIRKWLRCWPSRETGWTSWPSRRRNSMRRCGPSWR